MRWAFVIVCVAWIACGSVPRHPYAIEPGYEGAPELTGVFLAPLNATNKVAPELRDGRDYTFEVIKAYLEEHGKTPVETTAHRYRRAWSHSVRDVEFTKPTRREPFPPLPQEAAARLFERLSRYGDFDVVVMSDLVVRGARPAGTSLRWDGVRRNVAGMHGAGVSLRGEGWPAVSLLVQAYDREGRRVFHGVGGLDIAFRLKTSEVKVPLREGSITEDNRPPRNAARSMDSLLTDPEHTREGVQLAFHPLLAYQP